MDDIGAIVVIATFYAGGISFPPLLAAALLLATMGVLRFRGVRWLPVFVLLGTAVWFACYESGVHATIAGPFSACWLPPAPPPHPVTLADPTYRSPSGSSADCAR